MTKILPTVGRVVWFPPSRLIGDGALRISTAESRSQAAKTTATLFETSWDSNSARFEPGGRRMGPRHTGRSGRCLDVGAASIDIVKRRQKRCEATQN
jgi:hypothetical protein